MGQIWELIELLTLLVLAGIGAFSIIIIGGNYIHEYFEVQNFYSQGNYNISEFVLLGWNSNICKNNPSCSDVAVAAWTSGNYSVIKNLTFNTLWDQCWQFNFSACYILTKIKWKLS